MDAKDKEEEGQRRGNKHWTQRGGGGCMEERDKKKKSKVQKKEQEVDVSPVCSHPHDMILEASSSSLVDGFNLIDDD